MFFPSASESGGDDYCIGAYILVAAENAVEGVEGNGLVDIGIDDPTDGFE
jgi:hypothetical protein